MLETQVKLGPTKKRTCSCEKNSLPSEVAGRGLVSAAAGKLLIKHNAPTLLMAL